MKKFYLLLTGILCCALLPGQQPGKKVELKASDVTVTAVEDGFSTVSFDGSVPMAEIGEPALPMLTYQFVLPQGAKVEGVSVQQTVKEKLRGEYRIYPAQEPIPEGYRDRKYKFEIKQEVYASSLEYPGRQVEILDENTESGYRLVTVGVYPVSYIPATGEVFVSSLDITVQYSQGDATHPAGSPARQSAFRASLSKAGIQARVENPEDVEKFSPQVQVVKQSRNIMEIDTASQIQPLSAYLFEELVPDYIIITSEELKESFQPLVEWKRQIGIPTIIKTVEEIYHTYPGIDKPEQIRNYLIECNKRWGAGLFVLIGGNNDIVPAREVPGEGSKNWVTDLYYATTDETWYSQSSRNGFVTSTSGHNLNVGRAPVKDKEDVDNFVRKVLNYEKGNFTNSSYVNNFLSVMAMKDRSDCLDEQGKSLPADKQIRFTSTQNNYYHRLKGYMQEYLPSRVLANTKLLIDNYQCTGTIYNYRSTSTYCRGNKNAPFPTPEDCLIGDFELSSWEFFNQLNTGNYHLIYHTDHSNIKSLGASSGDKSEALQGEDVLKLSNGNHLQVMFSNGCDPATFSAPDCFGAQYINARNGGGVAFIGNSDVGYYSEVHRLPVFFQELYHTSKNNLAHIHRSIAMESEDWKRRLQLLGDPSMQVWTDVPEQLRVSWGYESITPGEISISVQPMNLPIGGGRICIIHGTDGYYSGEISGNRRHYFTLSDFSSPEIMVTVTAPNYYPYSTKMVIPVPAVYPKIQEVHITDRDGIHTTSDGIKVTISGNGNGFLDPGEKVLMNIYVESQYDFRPDLRCNNTIYFSFLDKTYLGNSMYRLDYEAYVDENILRATGGEPIFKNDLNPVTLTLGTIGKEYIIEDKFNVDVYNYKLEPVNVNFTYDNGVMFLTIELQNTGISRAMGISAYLECLDNKKAAQPHSPYMNYGNIYPGNITDSYTHYIFEVLEPEKGYPTLFMLQAKDRYGRINSYILDFSYKPQTPPFGFSYTAKTNEIALRWNSVGGTNTKGYNIYEVSPQGTKRRKANRFLNPHTYFVDYNVEPTSDYYYRIAAVAHNGMEGPLSETFKASTTFGYKGLFPVTMNFSLDYPNNSAITFYDINRDGKKDIFLSLSQGSQGYILGFNPDGTELFNIDHNTTTYSGFANVGAEVTGAVSAGILGNQAYPQVFSAKRYGQWRSGHITGYLPYDRDGDGHPDTGFQSRETTEGGLYLYGPVIARLTQPLFRRDNIVIADGGSDKEITLKTYDSGGTLEWTAKVPNIEGLANQSNIAVGNLGNGYYPDVIIGTNSGVYGYNYQGNSIGISGMLVRPGTISPVFSKAGYAFPFSSPIIADLDGDGVNEIIIRGTQYPYSTADGTKNNTTIFVFDRNGKLKPGWGTNQTKILGVGANGLAVADIYGNGNMYVIEQGYEVINIYDKGGRLVKSHSIPGLKGRQVPIVADMDGDNEAEIIVLTGTEIISYKMNGTVTPGFPIQLSNEYLRNPRLAVCDLDGTGKSDLVAALGTSIYVWETPGRADRIEWGMERGDAQLTGVYTSPKMRTLMEAFNFGEPEIEPDKLTGVLKEDCKLYQNTPNPFSNLTEISYYVPCDNCQVSIDIYHVQGNRVKSYTSLPGGSASIQLSAGELSSGFYIYSLMVNGELVDTRYMVVN